MMYLLTLSALVLIGFALLGLIIGLGQALYDAPYGTTPQAVGLTPSKLRHAMLDGLALGSIVVSLYWLCAIAYGLSAT